jgi:hypothetical protein
MRYFVGTELGVANAIQRHFDVGSLRLLLYRLIDTVYSGLRTLCGTRRYLMHQTLARRCFASVAKILSSTLRWHLHLLS